MTQCVSMTVAENMLFRQKETVLRSLPCLLSLLPPALSLPVRCGEKYRTYCICYAHFMLSVFCMPQALGSIKTFAGTGKRGYMGDGGQANAAELFAPGGLAIDGSTGDVYITDEDNNCIRMVSKNGVITTVAGTGNEPGYSGDGGPATSSYLFHPSAVSLSANAAVLYICDCFNNRIRMVTKRTGIITTLAGNGEYGFSGDGGPASEASLASPSTTAVDSVSGNIYIADSSNSRIRMVTVSNGIISTVAGTGSFGSTGDGGPALSAKLGYPIGLAVATSSGNLYISDYLSNCVRMIEISTGIITTIAGTGAYGSTGDGGKATVAALKYPAGLALDSISGNLFICGAGSNRIRMVTKSTGIISTVAGNGSYAYTGDGGPAINATFNGASSIALDASSGTMYIADRGNNVVRAVSRGVTASSAPSTAVTPTPSSNAPDYSRSNYPTNNSSQYDQPSYAPSQYGEIRDLILAMCQSNSPSPYLRRL